jgi:hypothetical protein
MAKSKQQRQREANTARIQRELRQTEGKLKGSLLKAKITPLKQALANKAETQARLRRKQAASKASVSQSKARVDKAKAAVATATKNRDRLRRKTMLIEAQKGARKAGEHAASNVRKHTLKERAAKALDIAGYLVPVGGAAKAGYAAGKALLTKAAKKAAGSGFKKRSKKAAERNLMDHIVKSGTRQQKRVGRGTSDVKYAKDQARRGGHEAGKPLSSVKTGAKNISRSKPKSMQKTASDAHTKADRKRLNIGQGTAKNRRRPPSKQLGEVGKVKDTHPGAPISSNLKTGARKKKRYDTKGREY